MKSIYLLMLSSLLLLCSCQKDSLDDIDRPAKAMSITKIDVLSYPITRTNGNFWDFSTGPDIFIALSEGTSIYATDRITGLANNATGAGVAFTLSSPATINKLTTYWSIGAYDADDFDADDYMGGIYFSPSDYQDNLPETILLTTAELQLRLYVTWNF